ncbi:MAG: cytochrome P450 [Sulfurifustis sp.]
MSVTPNANTFPSDPVAAVTHRDPYPYYADLVATKPLYRDSALGLWVASSAHAVTAALTHEACRVRPAAEPVPRAIADSPAGEIFGRLVRMNDGPGHCPFKTAVAAALASLEPAEVMERAQTCAEAIAQELQPTANPAALTDFAFRLSAHVMGSLLGVPREKLNQTAQWVGDFVRCVFPGGTTDDVERGKLAAAALLELFGDVYACGRARPGTGLLTTLTHEAERVGRAAADVIIANSIGFLSQAYEATAGLIGNSLLALAARPELRERIANERAGAREMILEVLRYDPPTHNTRRFLAQDANVAGQDMKAGDAILVVLAAANRDPAANPEPHRFEPSRRERRLYTFGAGVHSCPGDLYAIAIAEAAVLHLLDAGLDVDRMTAEIAYRPSANTRIPLFGGRRA